MQEETDNKHCCWHNVKVHNMKLQCFSHSCGALAPWHLSVKNKYVNLRYCYFFLLLLLFVSLLLPKGISLLSSVARSRLSHEKICNVSQHLKIPPLGKRKKEKEKERILYIPFVFDNFYLQLLFFPSLPGLHITWGSQQNSRIVCQNSYTPLL